MDLSLFGSLRRPALATRNWRNETRPAYLMALAICLASCATIPDPALVALPPAQAGVSQMAAAVTGRDAVRVLLVRRLTIPEYMMSRRVRFWSDTGYLAEWPNTYWAERIEIGVAREFVARLRDQLPGWTICDATCFEGTPDQILEVDLLRLDVLRSERRIDAIAQIQLVSTPRNPPTLPGTNVSLQTPILTVPISTDTPQSQAQAMAVLLQVLARASVTTIQLARASTDARQ